MTKGEFLWRIKKKIQKTLAQNKKARHEYFILETIEAGIELAGTEVKSARWVRLILPMRMRQSKTGKYL